MWTLSRNAQYPLSSHTSGFLLLLPLATQSEDLIKDTHKCLGLVISAMRRG